MLNIRGINFTIRNKLLLFIGGLVSIVIIGITIATIIQWKNMILVRHLENSKALTNTFAISVIDAFVYSETDEQRKENFLDNYILNFQKNVEKIKSISVVDINKKVIANSDPKKYNTVIPDSLASIYFSLNSLDYSIYETGRLGWVMEIVTPLKIAQKKWGYLIIVFDANALLDEVKSVVLLMISIGIFVILLTIIILFFIINNLMRSLKYLVDIMDKTDLEFMEKIKTPVKNDEVGFLINRFEQLKIRLSNSKLQLIDAQKQIYQAEKLASIGRLASGVAHEINNPLNGIKSCIYAIKNDPDNPVLYKQYVELIDEGLIYIENIVNKLIGFARQQSKVVDEVNINEVISKSISLLDFKLSRKHINLNLVLDEKLSLIKADPQLLQEVCMNLIINSYDAISPGGFIEIKTGNMDNGKVYFSVQDNGTGIKEEELKHIFDPFFTTKGPGEGTGLGLSVSQGIIESHGGKIEVTSIPEKETKFTVILPKETNENIAN
jgi:two-component system, NtrC family, sensor kinase